MEELRISSLWQEADKSIAYPYLAAFTYPWEALSAIGSMIEEIAGSLPRDEFEEIAPSVFVAKSARIAKTACIDGPCIICENAEVRHGAFIRGKAIVGRGAVVGNSTELKNCILFDGVQVPHFNYVGDSILGHRAHMGAGSIASNFRSDKGNITVRSDEESIASGLRKLGTMLGDFAEVGCNAVLCPGSIVGRGSIVYPLTRVRGVIPANSILKGDGVLVPRKTE